MTTPEIQPDAEPKPSSADDVMASLKRSYDDLRGTDLKVCFLSLSIFPEDSVIRKRPLIYWWIGEGFVTPTEDKTAEEVGEDIFAELLRKELILKAPGETNCSALVKNCVLHPWIRLMLISLANEAELFDFEREWPLMPLNFNSKCECRRSCLVDKDPPKPVKPRGDEPVKPQGGDEPEIPQAVDIPLNAKEMKEMDDKLKLLLTVFNVNVQYLDLKQEWLEKLKRVEVLNFGRWQGSPTHHIEVEQKMFDGSRAVGFLNGLGAQKHLKYLSLRGISRISELPASIRSLISLEILDLRACHDLEGLPSEITSLKKLTHLDVAECYLLEGMPKGLHKLQDLQVLKGFLVGSQEKNASKLSEITELKKLRRLSIHIGNEAVVQQAEYDKLKEMSSVRYLKISWGVTSADQSMKLFFPPNLEKLDLQGFPLSVVPDGLRASEMIKLKKLYIRGGELVNFKPLRVNNDVKWSVEILRLKYLKKLELNDVVTYFPLLQYSTVDVKDPSKAEE